MWLMTRTKARTKVACVVVTAVLLCFAACSDDLTEVSLAPDNGAGKIPVWRSPEIMTRAQSQAYFLRDHAVGYSYNALEGRDCSIDDVRCQVVDRNELDRLSDVSAYFLYSVNNENKVSAEGSVYHSVTEYVQNAFLKASGEAKITLIAGGEAKAKCDIFEDGVEDCFIVEATSKVSSGTYRMDAYAVAELAKSHPEVLTAPFREAVRQVAAAPENRWQACVDSFIKVYGTHVVTYAEMGGSLDVLVQINEKRFKTQEMIEIEVELSADALAGLFKGAWGMNKTDSDYEFLQDTRCNITARGGDVSLLDRLSSLNAYNVAASDTSTLSLWQRSVMFNTNDFSKSTAAVIDMDFTPIYELVNDPVAYRRLSAIIDGNVQGLIDLMGNRNFINVSFPYDKNKKVSAVFDYDGYSNRMSSSNPAVTNIIFAGRHVATICKEQVNDIDTSEYVRIVYPIYEGRIQLANGLTYHNGHAYRVAWHNDQCTVTDLGEQTKPTSVYITAGVPSFSAYENISYAAGHLLLGLEIDTPFLPDGTSNGNAKRYSVKKFGGHFYLPDSKGNSTITGIPNWSYDTEKEMMKRDNDYIYIYNPNEMRYYE